MNRKHASNESVKVLGDGHRTRHNVTSFLAHIVHISLREVYKQQNRERKFFHTARFVQYLKKVR